MYIPCRLALKGNILINYLIKTGLGREGGKSITRISAHSREEEPQCSLDGKGLTESSCQPEADLKAWGPINAAIFSAGPSGASSTGCGQINSGDGNHVIT